ncbi:MAG: enoyl-ACP reductase [Neisseriales bacterium]|jgi:enoyl-[acyl-carrier protein] reductase I|nr:MAG: enoyl-ACP reductase [Neisseriales bacterium]
MGFLQGKKILITGLISDRSIAYGVAKACFQQGAELAFTYQNEKHRDRVAGFAKEFNSDLVFPLDVGVDEQITNLFVELEKKWDGLDGVLHSIAFTPKNGLVGDFVDNVDRETFKISNDISAYSFIALGRAARKMMQGRNGCLICLSYLGGERVLPNYNMAGVAKAALESSTRYMAFAMGAEGIRVNAVSAGPIKTLAASGIGNFGKILDHMSKFAPLRRGVTTEEVGNSAAFLFSQLASGITGEVLYVDAGYNITAGGLEG